MIYARQAALAGTDYQAVRHAAADGDYVVQIIYQVQYLHCERVAGVGPVSKLAKIVPTPSLNDGVASCR